MKPSESRGSIAAVDPDVVGAADQQHRWGDVVDPADTGERASLSASCAGTSGSPMYLALGHDESAAHSRKLL
ncbi:hypothetical protein WIS52_08370 [Pseudonocardia nematodicida]|uniref:Uncharacterized protein n=1 Tax=Pseudonocardia nematodicida TaxID=1206997 RepID=A0ABV1K7L0_9PSEU